MGHFTFEYPSGYDFDKVEVRDDLGYTNVRLSGTVHVSILVDTVYGESSTPADFVDYDISRYEQWEDFKLLDRSSEVFLGVQAEQATYFYQQMQMPIAPNPATYVPTIEREIYFFHGNRLWCLRGITSEAKSEAGMADFEHILETFKILE